MELKQSTAMWKVPIINDFKKSIVYLDQAYGHYNLRIPKCWLAVNEYTYLLMVSMKQHTN